MSHRAPFIVALGTAQDAGFPQIGCRLPCCARAWREPSLQRDPACLAIVDPLTQQRWLLDCTPAFPRQLRCLETIAPLSDEAELLDGIMLTHAHVGHYAGLIHLGKEAMDSDRLPVWVMPGMQTFLTQNAPWESLVTQGNISLCPLNADVSISLNPRISVTPWRVPHRDDYSETVAFFVAVQGGKRALYLPDIDAWEPWERSLSQALSEVDIAFLDGTFFDDSELPHRDTSTIPHPRIAHTLELLNALPEKLRRRVHFIHLNHSNPALVDSSEAARQISRSGCKIAQQGVICSLGSSSPNP